MFSFSNSWPNILCQKDATGGDSGDEASLITVQKPQPQSTLALHLCHFTYMSATFTFMD